MTMIQQHVFITVCEVLRDPNVTGGGEDIVVRSRTPAEFPDACSALFARADRASPAALLVALRRKLEFLKARVHFRSRLGLGA